MNAILVAVNYTDLLKVTLPYNRHHFERVMVVTDASCAYDVATVCDANRAEFYVTDAFYRNGARFNKWLALEEGLDVLGRDGWLCLLDADVLWPKAVDLERYLRPGLLYTPYRYMCEDLSKRWEHVADGVRDFRPYPPEDAWHGFHLHRQEREFAGYTQIFHASDPALGPPPWHQTDWAHAGGADSFFQAKWSEAWKVRPDFRVLHLGPAGQNWCGRVTPYLDGGHPPGADDRRQALRGYMLARRKAPPGAHHFDAERIGS